MLSEILFASVPTKRAERPDRVPGISCSQLFPCPYRLYKVHTGFALEEELTSRDVLNMDDGWWQEEQTIQRLKQYAGINISSRQQRITVGKSQIPGTIDGIVRLSEKTRLWEHKAWSIENFGSFVRWGLERFPQQKAQVNAYMLGTQLDECLFMVKHKDTNDYRDIVVPLDREFILPIIEWADRIRMDKWVPEPELCKYCGYCGLNCFGTVVDFSWVAEAKAGEMAEKWREGKKLQAVGEMMIDDARTYFVGKKDKEGNVLAEGIIGDKELLLVEGLKIQLVPQRRWDISRESIIREFGVEGFLKVASEKVLTTYRITEE